MDKKEFLRAVRALVRHCEAYGQAYRLFVVPKVPSRYPQRVEFTACADAGDHADLRTCTGTLALRYRDIRSLEFRVYV